MDTSPLPHAKDLPSGLHRPVELFGAPSAQSRLRARSAALLIGAALGSALVLSGCGQEIKQEGGTLPVPHATVDGDRHVTPGPVDSQEEIIGPGYAPPRTAGPTQTAVPNLPGGKL